METYSLAADEESLDMMAVLLAGGFVLAGLAPWLVGRLGVRAGWVLALGPAAMFLALCSKWGGIRAGTPHLESWPWVEPLGVVCSFHLDGLALLFALLITGIGALVTLYAGAYMEDRRDQGRFYFWLLFFLASMVGVVTADHVVMLFIFWELTSISSYFLIGFDHDREEARAGALQALLVTALGGLALLAGLLLMSLAGGADSLSALVSRGDVLRAHTLYPAILGLVAVAAFTKSAQFPFHFWLPNAMEAPTPVSAFLHSSTMVKAGVYLLARLSPALGGTMPWTVLLTSVGGITLLIGAMLALRQTVLKKLLAYSTVSALGLMVMMTGLAGDASPEAAEALAMGFAAFLLGHALYKAALFLVAGTLTHATGHKSADGLAGLRAAMPWTAAAALAAGLSMAGIPPLLGFVAKETVLSAGLGLQTPAGVAAATAVTLAAAAYVVVALLVAWTPFAGRRPEGLAAHKPPTAMRIGPMVLASLGLAAGLLPGLFAEPLVLPAAGSLLGRTDLHGHLALWHGFNAPLLLSTAGAAAGWALWRLRPSWQTAFARCIDWTTPLGPEMGYHRTMTGVLAVARLQTRFLQSGLIRYYLLFVIAFSAAVACAAMLRVLPGGTGWLPDPILLPDILATNLPDLAICLLILGGTFGTVHARSRLAAIASLGSVGYGVALIYMRYGAPDLAITQVLVETLTVIILVLVFYHLPPFPRVSGWPTRIRDFIVACAAGMVMTVMVLVTYRVQAFPAISDWYADHSVPDGKGRNIVNVILVDFRSFDTLGEITVLAVAALGVYALLKLRPHQSDAGDPPP